MQFNKNWIQIVINKKILVLQKLKLYCIKKNYNLKNILFSTEKLQNENMKLYILVNLFMKKY